MSKFHDQSTAKYYDPSVSVDSLTTDDAEIGEITGMGPNISDKINTREGMFVTQANLTPDGTAAEDLLAINSTEPSGVFSMDLRVDCHVPFTGGDPSHKIAVVNYSNQGSNVSVIDSYRENSFRNQLEITIDTTNSRILLSSTGTDAAAGGTFLVTLSGHLDAAKMEVL